MPYGFYLRKNYRKYRKVKAKPSMPVKPVYKYSNKKAVAKRGPRASFTQKVQAIISRNNENKFTQTLTAINPVSLFTNGQFNFFVWTPGQDVANNRLFNLQSGTQEGQRLGNDIKLKRWVIKGIIEPKYRPGEGTPLNNATLENSYVGYVDVYFGKYLKNSAPISTTLGALYQNGSATSTPACKSTDMLYPLNKDGYKVYYHRRFKMGAASDSVTYNTNIATLSVSHPANNDFNVSKTFGFDVCKYILKNKVLKYNDGGLTSPFEPPQNLDIVNLSVWATFTPLQGQCSVVGSGTTGYNFWQLNCLSYAEYEDA